MCWINHWHVCCTSLCHENGDKDEKREIHAISPLIFPIFNGGVWSAYAVLIKDYYIGIPNGIGFVLGSAQLILYTIYKNKSTDEETEDKKEEEGSAHLVKGPIQMEDFNENRSLNKGNSLPKPSLIRQYSQNIVKTLSLSPLELEKLRADKDIEKGFT